MWVELTKHRATPDADKTSIAASVLNGKLLLIIGSEFAASVDWAVGTKVRIYRNDETKQVRFVTAPKGYTLCRISRASDRLRIALSRFGGVPDKVRTMKVAHQVVDHDGAKAVVIDLPFLGAASALPSAPALRREPAAPPPPPAAVSPPLPPAKPVPPAPASPALATAATKALAEIEGKMMGALVEAADKEGVLTRATLETLMAELEFRSWDPFVTRLERLSRDKKVKLTGAGRDFKLTLTP